MKYPILLKTGVAPLALGLALAANPAFAQETVLPATPSCEDSDGDGVCNSDEEGGIVVTGSRIRRSSEFNSPDPITVINPETAQAQGQFSTAQMLQSSSIAAGSNQITSAISTVSGVTNGGPGAETISLRGLGANRTLVLLNGRRAGPAGTRGGVSSFDLNVLPQSIVANIEVLKTGASSVYGSDAVAGVVNLITKKDTNGLEITGSASVPEQSGGQEYRLSAAWGKKFDRGHILIAADYFRRDELKGRDRDYLDCPEEYIFRPGTSTRADPIDPRTGSPRCATFAWGHVWVYNSGFDQQGRWQYSYGNDNLGRYVPSNQGDAPGFVTPPGFFEVGYDGPSAGIDNLYHPFIANSSVIPKTDRYTGYIDAEYEIFDGVNIGTELLFNRRETRAVSSAQFYYFTGYTDANPLHVGWSGPYYLSPTPITDHAGGRQKVDYYRGLVYANGNFGNGSGLLGDWNWDIWGQYSRSEGTYWSDVIYRDAINTANLQTGLNTNGTNTSSTRCVLQGGVYVSPISLRPCIDINWTDPQFLYGNLTTAQRNFLYGEDVGETLFTQLIGEVSFSGSIIDLPAGKVQAVIGGTIRRDAIEDIPGVEQRRNNNFVGSAAGITAGYTITKELFGEIEIPLFHNTPFIESFTITGAARLTNFSATQDPRSGTGTDKNNGNWTYSIGANWKVNDWLRFRARYGTSFRAPALFELFLGDQVSGGTNRAIDPCVNYPARVANGTLPAFIGANCAAGTSTLPGIPADTNPIAPGQQPYAGGGIQPSITTGGGVGVLDPETSTAYTGSVILTPSFDFLPTTDISLAVDYFNIEINGEIATLSAANVVNGCYASDDFPNEPLCNFFTRQPVGTASQYNLANVNVRFININSQRNEGVDVRFNLGQDLGSLGRLKLIAQMTWQIKDEIEIFGGDIEDNNGEAGDPIWTGKFNAIWESSKQFSIAYGLDVIGRTNDEDDYRDLDANGDLCVLGSAIYGDYCVELIGEEKFYHSLSATYRWDNFQLTGGVSNLFDTRPPRTTITGGNLLNSGAVPTYGQSVFTSQYDLLGRRFFINATARF